MCGIIAVVGAKNNANRIVVNGLKNLEYRGYDSWGIAYRDKNLIRSRKNIGKLSGSEEILDSISTQPASLSMGHTRWATHGATTKANSHPHFSCDRDIAVVHNGIIENYQELRQQLESAGHKLRSETDTEVIAHLVEDEFKKSRSLTEAVGRALQQVKGAFAIAVAHEQSNTLVGARRGSPLVVGLGKDQKFLASDIPAFLTETNEVIFAEEGDLIELTEETIKIYSLDSGKKRDYKVDTISWSQEQAQKGEFDHFMIKEIFDQPSALEKVIAHSRLEIEALAEIINNSFGTYFTACGTAYHAALGATYLFSRIAHKHVNVCVASEFPNYEHFLKEQTLLVLISQSGETADTLEALRAAKRRGSKTMGIVNVQGSTLVRESDHHILTQAGPELCVLATKSFTSQLALVTLLAYASQDQYFEGRELVLSATSAIKEMLNDQDKISQIKRIAKSIAKTEHLYTIGRGLNYPTALEAALKIKEVSYIHAEGFAGGELKHGSIALIEKGTPVIVFASNDETKAEIISNAMEVRSRGAYVIGISPENNEVFDEWIPVADLPNAMPIVGSVPAQILAYYLAIERGTDPDKPRNLAKSVTVK